MAFMPYLNALIIWLKKDPVGKERYLLPFWMFVFDVVASLGIGILFYFLGIGAGDPSPAAGWSVVSPAFVPEAFLIALIEEGVFRIIPLIIALRIWGIRTPTLVVVLVSSILFGLAHGEYYHLFIQGLGGILYCLLFLKFSKSGKDLLFPSTLVVGVHAVFDISMGLLIALSGASTF